MLSVVGKEVGLEVNAAVTKHIFVYCYKNAGQNYHMKVDNNPLKMWRSSSILELNNNLKLQNKLMFFLCTPRPLCCKGKSLSPSSS